MTKDDEKLKQLIQDVDAQINSKAKEDSDKIQNELNTAQNKKAEVYQNNGKIKALTDNFEALGLSEEEKDKEITDIETMNRMLVFELDQIQKRVEELKEQSKAELNFLVGERNYYSSKLERETSEEKKGK
jgi:hypothetical protein